MEEFLKLDWTPRAEDILDNRYVDDNRLKNESITYKILQGSFNNPFADVRKQVQSVVKQTAKNSITFKQNPKTLEQDLKNEPTVSNSIQEM